MNDPIIIPAFGMYHRSYREASEVAGVPQSTIRYRLRGGYMDTEVALVCTDPVSFQFVGPDDRAYYKLVGKDGVFTAREIVKRYCPDLLATYDKCNPTGKLYPFRPTYCHRKYGDA